jgi:hypothetical protein
LKKKIGILLICILLISFAIPASGVFTKSNKILLQIQDPDQDNKLRNQHLNDGRLPPDPGDMALGFVLEYNQEVPFKPNMPEKTFSATHETIVEILENIDEDLILGYLEDITAFGPRRTGTTACQQAGEYIYEEFVSYGLEARYDDWSYGGNSGNNIEGTLPGIDEESDEIYIICAHYDSVSGSPGADDDGSGTAAVLAAAYVMSQFQFNHTIRFVAFDGEEQGLLGSHEYAKEASQNGDNIVGALNGDMIGYAANPTQASYIKIYSNSVSEWIRDITDEVSQDYYDYCELEIVPMGPAYNSDHASFWTYGFHAIMYHEYEFNPYYHSPQDIIENMDVDYSTRVTKLEIATLGTIAEAQVSNNPPSTPSLEGPTTGTEYEEITFTTSSTDPDEDQIFYEFDWDDGTFGWFGPYTSGETIEATHSWDTPDTYDIKVRAVDVRNKKSEWSIPLNIEIGPNQAPNAPTITGPNTGTIKKLISFKVTAIDPEGHDVYYSINWGDGNYMPYDGPYSSGEEVTFSHAWNEPDDYSIAVKAKDEFEGESSQTSFKLKISRSKAAINPSLFQFLEKLLYRGYSLIELIIALIKM